MFKRIGPGKVRHDSGYVVRAVDRWKLGIEEGGRSAVVAVDYGAAGAERMYISAGTLSAWQSAQGPVEMGAEERQLTLAKLAAGLKAMVSADVQVIVEDE